jgi:hypothetical protein
MPNSFNNTFQIRHHLFIGEPQNVETFRDKKGVTILIGSLPFFEVMRLAVKLDDDLCRHANEVGDVIADRNLPAKAEPINSIGLQVAPQQGFSTCHRLAKLLRSAALARTDYGVRHSRLPPSLALPHKGGGNRKSAGRNFCKSTHELNPPARVGTSSGLKP